MTGLSNNIENLNVNVAKLTENLSLMIRHEVLDSLNVDNFTDDIIQA